MSEAGPESLDRLALVQDFEALANEQRLQILHYATRPHHTEEIADHFGMTRQAAAKHVDKLLARGFLRSLNGRRSRGPVTEFHVVPQKIFALQVDLSALTRLEPVGGPETRRAEPTIEAPGHAELDPVARTLPRSPTAQLLVLTTPTSAERVVLEPDVRRWSVGRDADRTIRITHDPYASARHAEIQRASDAFDIVDQYSSNGTMLNFAPLPKGARLRLHSGDVITIGRTSLVFQANA